MPTARAYSSRSWVLPLGPDPTGRDLQGREEIERVVGRQGVQHLGLSSSEFLSSPCNRVELLFIESFSLHRTQGTFLAKYEHPSLGACALPVLARPHRIRRPLGGRVSLFLSLLPAALLRHPGIVWRSECPFESRPINDIT